MVGGRREESFDGFNGRLGSREPSEAWYQSDGEHFHPRAWRGHERRESHSMAGHSVLPDSKLTSYVVTGGLDSGLGKGGMGWVAKRSGTASGHVLQGLEV